jgi:hypothetical protein
LDKKESVTMNRIVVKSKVSRDGILHLSVPIGLDEAEKDVQVTVEPSTPATPMTREQWCAWVDSMAGTWQGDFQRPPQGEYDAAAEEYGKARAHLAALGTPIGPNDLLIAAIALAHGLTVVTHNTAEFSRVRGLSIEDWE